MDEVIFLIILGLVWVIFASIQDLKKREVANWISFSLIIFALGYRFFYSLFSNDYNFLLQGIIGLGIFFIIGNLLYYARIFAGGDAKLMIALGTILPISESFFTNIQIFIFFLIIFLFVGGTYGFIISLVMSIRNFDRFKKEFVKRLKKNKRLIYPVMIFSLIIMVFGLNQANDNLLFYLGIIVFAFPYFYLYAKSVDESCMVKSVSTNKLTVGDWLYEDVKIGRKKILVNWAGLNESQIKILKKHKKKVLIRFGIPFVPVFFFSFIILIYFWFTGSIDFLGLGNSLR